MEAARLTLRLHVKEEPVGAGGAGGGFENRVDWIAPGFRRIDWTGFHRLPVDGGGCNKTAIWLGKDALLERPRGISLLSAGYSGQRWLIYGAPRLDAALPCPGLQ